ncbi:tetratricopeptide repeat protein [Algibacter aquimarinus]|uniref:Tetratricopeptide repeat-containing protein n=1 Tax=Algibacter aquimarinus TaxID=1136748 RepID=A0ABP9HN87_9FLAO
MRKFLFFLFLSIPLCFSGQNKKNIDSLIQVYSTTTEDKAKLLSGNKITSYYLYRDINKAYSFATKQLTLSKKIDNTDIEMKASHHLAIIHGSLSHFDSARYYINNTLKLAKRNDDLTQQSLSNHSLVMLEISLGNLDEAQQYNTENLAFNKKIKDTFGLALSYDTESSINIDKGQYKLALTSVLKSLEIFETLNNEIRVADAYNKIAVIENSLENYDSSIKYSKKALKIYEDYEDLEFQASILNILGISYKMKKDYSQALKFLNKSSEISNKNGYKSILLVSYAHLIDIYFELDDKKRAKELIDSGIEIANFNQNKGLLATFQYRKAIYFKKLDQYNKAINLLDVSIENSVNGDLENLSEIYKEKSNVLKLKNDYKEALSNYETYKKLQDSSSKKVNITKINELRITHQTEQKETEIALQEQEIKNLNQEVKVSNLTKTLYGIGMFSILTIAGLIFISFRQRMKKNKIEREKQEAIYKQEIAFKKKELASQTLHLVQKNTFIQELKENLVKIKQSPELFKVEFRRLVMLLKKQSAEDKDWEVFKSYFSEVHNNFDNKLKHIYADINEKEIRLASFIRMNLSTKEIASMLNVLPDSVLKSKYRLKKKLNLPKEADLNTFLNNL